MENQSKAIASEILWRNTNKKKENPRFEIIIPFFKKEEFEIIQYLVNSQALNEIINLYQELKIEFERINTINLGEKKIKKIGIIFKKKIEIYSPNNSLKNLNNKLKLFYKNISILTNKLKIRNMSEDNILIKLFLETQREIIEILDIISNLEKNEIPGEKGFQEQIKIKIKYKKLINTIDNQKLLSVLFN